MLTIYILLKNQLQAFGLDSINDAATSVAREVFEVRWNRWNVIRTVASCVILALLLVVLGCLS